ncbi:MAG: hypothetical protein MJA83_11525 [Gammaproteobacteria bacterium]|nr:hypothetical protein [Gammaproteobacteria bacterium]
MKTYAKLNRVLVVATTFLLLTLPATAWPSWSATHSLKTIRDIYSPTASRPCLLFRLVGVTQADPIVQSQYFAVSNTNVDYNSLFALLMMSYGGNKTVTVYTTGQSVCNNFAEVGQIRLD